MSVFEMKSQTNLENKIGVGNTKNMFTYIIQHFMIFFKSNLLQIIIF